MRAENSLIFVDRSVPKLAANWGKAGQNTATTLLHFLFDMRFCSFKLLVLKTIQASSFLTNFASAKKGELLGQALAHRITIGKCYKLWQSKMHHNLRAQPKLHLNSIKLKENAINAT